MIYTKWRERHESGEARFVPFASFRVYRVPVILLNRNQAREIDAIARRVLDSYL